MQAPRLLGSAVAVSLFVIAAYFFGFSQSSPLSLPTSRIAPVKPVIEDFYGTKITDPYRYMENLRDPEVLAWIKAQDARTRSILVSLPGRDKLLSRIEQLDHSVPQVQAGRMPGDVYFLLKSMPGENTPKLYVRQGMRGDDLLLVDPEKLTLAPIDQGKGANVIDGLAVSENGQYLAVEIKPGGDERSGELHVIDVHTGHETGDVITQVGAEAYQPYWLPDDHSFVYGHLQHLPPGAPPAEVRKKFRAYLHVMGTSFESDQPIFGYGVVPSITVDPSLIASVHIQPGSHWAVGVLNGSTTPNSAYYLEPLSALGKTNSRWRKIADFSDGVTDLAVHDDQLYLLTYKNAPRYQVLRLDAHKPDLASAEVVVPPADAVVTNIAPAQDALYVTLSDGGLNRVLRVPYGPHPDVQPVALPFEGTVFISAEPRLPGALIYMTSWTRAFKIYSYDPTAKQIIDTQIQTPGPYDEPANIESVEVKVPSYDGTLVPLSIVYPKDIKFDGSNPTLLEGYGGYGISIPAYFEPARLAWHEQRGIIAICHVRGGGEYGEEWHLAGKQSTKPNTWRDFIACAQYLIDKKYTSSSRIAGEGVSAGGILIGRSITSRPDLLAAAIDKVGASDMLRFEQTENGATNVPEFGTVKTETGFKTLLEMSPYHHVEEGTAYPAVLLETGMNDPLVDPWEMAKMTARLQAASKSGKPILLRVDFNGGHGSLGATRSQADEQRADEWSFLLWQFGIPEFQPGKP
jgi:prolyl oligopeptidase